MIHSLESFRADREPPPRRGLSAWLNNHPLCAVFMPVGAVVLGLALFFFFGIGALSLWFRYQDGLTLFSLEEIFPF